MVDIPLNDNNWLIYPIIVNKQYVGKIELSVDDEGLITFRIDSDELLKVLEIDKISGIRFEMKGAAEKFDLGI